MRNHVGCRSCPLVIAAAFCFAATAHAATITLEDQVILNGTGIGVVSQLLVLQQPNANDPTEGGSISWNGSADVRTGDAKPQSQTLTAQHLQTDLGISEDLALVLNVAEPGGSTVNVRDFSLVFQNAAGAELFEANWTGDVDLPPVGGSNGIGTSGHLFLVDLTPAEAAVFLGAAGNRLGMRTDLDFLDAHGAMEVFFVTEIEVDAGGEVPGEPIPEPASLGLLALMGAVALVRRRPRGD